MHASPFMKQDGGAQPARLPRPPGFIDGVYNYCDRWCERCRFQSRCRLYRDMRRMERVTEGRLDVVDLEALHSDEELELEETSPVSARERAEFLAGLSNTNTEPSSPAYRHLPPQLL